MQPLKTIFRCTPPAMRYGPYHAPTVARQVETVRPRGVQAADMGGVSGAASSPYIRPVACRPFLREAGGRPACAPRQLKTANNDVKDYYLFNDFLPVAIEWPAGTLRAYDDGYVRYMLADYGYIPGIPGNDGEDLDVYVGDDERSEKVFIVNQHKYDTGVFDEQKCMLGYSTEQEAIECYLAHMDPKNLGDVKEVSFDAFTKSLARAVEATGNKCDHPHCWLPFTGQHDYEFSSGQYELVLCDRCNHCTEFKNGGEWDMNTVL